MPTRKTASDTPQQTLLPPEVVVATLTVGVVGSGNHIQLQLEVRNGTDDQLLELESVPHRDLSELDATAARALSRLLELTRRHLIPF